MSRLAQYIVRLRDAGIEGRSYADARRLRAINTAYLLAAGITLGYCLFYAIYDVRYFSTEIVFLLLASFFYFGTGYFTRLGRAGMATWYLVSVALIHLGVISWLLGPASGVLNYLLIVPIILSLLIAEGDRVTVWPVALAVCFVFFIVNKSGNPGSFAGLPERTRQLFYLANIFGAVLVASGFAVIFRWLIQKAEADLETERRRSERLLLAILPAKIAEQLKTDDTRDLAQFVPAATSIFADIVGFTRWSHESDPQAVVAELNRIFSHIDRLAERRGIEKIKTIGDAYFAVCGLPEPITGHAENAADFALDIRQTTSGWQSDVLSDLAFRVTIDTGPVVAGVIGRTKFAYDAWGNAINAAARLEDHCQPGEILITQRTASQLPARFETEPVGQIDLRGQGQTEICRLLSRSDE